MSQGLQIFDSAGHLQFDTADSLGRVIYAGATNAAGIPNSAVGGSFVWVQVVDPAYSTRLWGIIIPTFRIDLMDTDELYWPGGDVYIDPVNQPGKVALWCSWYHPDTTTAGSAGTTTYQSYDQSVLVLGLY
jgi:hypothetical protein